MVGPSFTPEEQNDMAAKFSAAPLCCKSTELGFKVAQMCPAADGMVSNNQWKTALRLFAKQYKLCNMHMERALARIKRSYSHISGAPDVERVRSGGLVSELLSDHKALGGLDPRFLSRSFLLQKGLPLKRKDKKNPKRVKAGSGFSAFVRQQESKRKRMGTTLGACGGRKRRFSA